MKKVCSILIASLLASAMISCGGGKGTRKGGKGASDKYKGTATGYATIYDNDKAHARDRATDDAKIKLVRKVLGETISGTSTMRDFELVSSIVEARSTGLVKELKIIKKWQDGNEYFVTIEGRVQMTAIDDAIRSALENYGRPKFMVLIKEKFERKRNLPGFTETEIKMQEIMGDSGFDFVDANVTQELMRSERSKMNRAMRGRISDDVQQLLLNEHGAEVLIIGTAQTKDQSDVLKSYGDIKMKSKSAIIRIKAVDVYTGRILATMSSNAPGVHIENDTASKNAIENTLKRIVGSNDPDTGKFKSGKFVERIVAKFVRSATDRQINVNVAGLNFNELKKFRNDISFRVRGVKKVISRGQAGRYAKIEVIFAGKTEDFAEELSSKADNFGFSVEVKESYPNKLILRVKKQR